MMVSWDSFRSPSSFLLHLSNSARSFFSCSREPSSCKRRSHQPGNQTRDVMQTAGQSLKEDFVHSTLTSSTCCSSLTFVFTRVFALSSSAWRSSSVCWCTSCRAFISFDDFKRFSSSVVNSSTKFFTCGKNCFVWVSALAHSTPTLWVKKTWHGVPCFRWRTSPSPLWRWWVPGRLCLFWAPSIRPLASSSLKWFRRWSPPPPPTSRRTPSLWPPGGSCSLSSLHTAPQHRTGCPSPKVQGHNGSSLQCRTVSILQLLTIVIYLCFFFFKLSHLVIWLLFHFIRSIVMSFFLM